MDNRLGTEHFEYAIEHARVADVARKNGATLFAEGDAWSFEVGGNRLIVTDPHGFAETPLPAMAGPHQIWTFDTTGKQAIVPIPLAVPNGAVVAVTVEKAGGANSPTLPPLAASRPV